MTTSKGAVLVVGRFERNKDTVQDFTESAATHVGRIVVIIAGSPPGIPGSTNALRIHRMGDAINEAAPAYRRP